MRTPKQIDHIGVVEKMANGTVTVCIADVSACAGCHASGTCSMADKKDKSIEIPNPGESFHVGEKVNIAYRESLGWRAVTLAYVIPFIMVLATMFVTSAFTNNELWIGILGLVVLFPYYFALALFKNLLKKTFSFTIQKIA